MFKVCRDGSLHKNVPTLNAAIAVIEDLVCASTESTFVVVDLADEVIASVSSRRIIGIFYRQEYNKDNTEDISNIGEEPFDATDLIAKLTLEQLYRLKDDDATSDLIGRKYFSWGGLFSVCITDSICAYFGVNAMTDITQENFNYVRNRHDPKPTTEVLISVSGQMRVALGEGITVHDFIEKLHYQFESGTVGCNIIGTELVLAMATLPQRDFHIASYGNNIKSNIKGA